MTVVVINPGTGHIQGAQERWAHSNLRALLREAAPEARMTRRSEGEEDGSGGRWLFEVTQGNKSVLVHSPGCPRSHCVFPPTAPDVLLPYRFYVDGNSWMWPYAVSQIRDALGLSGKKGP